MLRRRIICRANVFGDMPGDPFWTTAARGSLSPSCANKKGGASLRCISVLRLDAPRCEPKILRASPKTSIANVHLKQTAIHEHMTVAGEAARICERQHCRREWPPLINALLVPFWPSIKIGNTGRQAISRGPASIFQGRDDIFNLARAREVVALRVAEPSKGRLCQLLLGFDTLQDAL